MSVRRVQKSIVYLESMGLVKRLNPASRGRWKLGSYKVTVPGEWPSAATAKTGEKNAPSPIGKTVDRTARSAEINPARHANIKCDDDQEKNSSSNSGNAAFSVNTPENHSPAALPQESEPNPAEILEKVRSAYEKATGNLWNHSDETAFRHNELDRVPLPRILATMESVVRHTPAKVNSFKYFIREIKASQDTRNRSWRKKQLEGIIRRMRDNATGLANYTGPDFLEDVKCPCAREGVYFDNDVFNDLCASGL